MPDWLDIDADLDEMDAMCRRLILDLRELKNDARTSEAKSSISTAQSYLSDARRQLRPFVKEAQEQEGEE